MTLTFFSLNFLLCFSFSLISSENLQRRSINSRREKNIGICSIFHYSNAENGTFAPYVQFSSVKNMEN